MQKKPPASLKYGKVEYQWRYQVEKLQGLKHKKIFYSKNLVFSKDKM